MSEGTITALFTERELEVVRRCCRDDDAQAPLRALQQALLRGARVEPPEWKPFKLPTLPGKH